LSTTVWNPLVCVIKRADNPHIPVIFPTEREPHCILIWEPAKHRQKGVSISQFSLAEQETSVIFVIQNGQKQLQVPKKKGVFGFSVVWRNWDRKLI
jgi:hypothetical protein